MSVPPPQGVWVEASGEEPEGVGSSRQEAGETGAESALRKSNQAPGCQIREKPKQPTGNSGGPEVS